jgi:hypothetical protein
MYTDIRVSKPPRLGCWSCFFFKYLDTTDMEALDANTRFITTVTPAERLLQNVFDDATRKPCTISQYCTRVMRLYKSMHAPREGFDTLDWVKDTGGIIGYLQRTYPTKLPTQATNLTPLLVIARKLWPGQQHIYKSLFKRYSAVRKSMDDARPAQQMSEREAKNWKSLDEIDQRRVELQRKVNRTIAPKRPEDVTTGEKVTLIRYLVLCLYTQMNAIKNDWSDLPVVRFEDLGSVAARELISGSRNYLFEYQKGSYRLHLNVYKTDKRHGAQKMDLPVRLCNVIAESLQIFPRKYLLSRMRTPDAPMGSGYLTKFLAPIYPDSNLGSCLLRKICVSNAMKDAPSLSERDELAKSMLHTANIAQRHYELKFKPDGSRIQF